MIHLKLTVKKLNNFFSKIRSTLIHGQIYLVCLVCFLFYSGSTLAQRNCTQKLKDAETAYKNGRLNEVSGIIKTCLAGGFNKDEQVQAFRLLALTYIYLDEQNKAEQAVLSLIKTAPDYKVNTANDPPEFIALFKSFRTVPVLIPTLKAGTNLSWPSVRETYLADNPALADPNYKSGFGYQLGVSLEVPVKEHITAGIEIKMAGKSFTNISTFNDFQTITVKEKQGWISIPLFGKYTYDLKSIYPFLVAGPTINILYSAKGSVERKNNAGASSSNSTIVDLMDLRNEILLGGMIGGGVSYKLGKGYVLAEVQYHHLFSSLTKNVALDFIPELPYGYGYIDDRFSMRTVSFSLGYTYPIYSPKKLR